MLKIQTSNLLTVTFLIWFSWQTLVWLGRNQLEFSPQIRVKEKFKILFNYHRYI